MKSIHHLITGKAPDKKEALSTDIYGITAEDYSLGRSNPEVVEEMLKAGVKIIQYREKMKDKGRKYEESMVIREQTKKYGALFIVNDDVDLALMVGADGIHLGQEDLPPENVRRLVGEEMIIGLSTHSPEQAIDALSREVDYIGVGPVYATNTKTNACAPVGLDYVKYVACNISLPFVAIGGIKEHNVYDVFNAGARCFAMVTEIVGASHIPGKIYNIRRILQRQKLPEESMAIPK